MKRYKFKNIKTKCKVLFITPSLDSGGAENILFNVVERMKKDNIVLISLTNDGFYGNKLRERGFKIYSLKMKKNIFLFLKIFEIFKIISKHKPEIVHTWLYHANLIGGLIARIIGIKKIIWSIHHDYEEPNFLIALEMKILILLSYFLPQKVVFCSLSSKFNHINKGYKESSSIVIKNGVSLDIFKPNKIYRRKIRSRLKVSEDCLLIGNIARYHPIKDHDNLLKALFLLKMYKVNFKCVLVGLGLTNNNLLLSQKINSLNLNNEVILYGRSFEIYKILNGFDVKVLSSKKEAFPISLLEAMAVEIPCISTNVGDAKEIIGDSGWITNICDPLSLALKLKEISEKRTLLNQKSLLTRKRVKSNFSLETMNLNYKKLYDSFK
tara:strand:+ start:5382 stop:6524 length:1143 start_codon:yes stop_codon:yes gene_type:complete